MSMLCNQPVVGLAPRGADGLAIIGRTLHDMRGIRFDEGEEGNKPDVEKPAEKTDDKDGEKKFSQAEVDQIVADRLARERRKPPASKPEDPKPAPKGEEQKEPKSLTQADVDAAIAAALATKDKELAIERAGDALDKALEGRTYSATAVRTLDLEQFVNEDGKTVDTKKLEKWVTDNTGEGPKRVTRDPSQGGRGTGDGGSVQSGKELFESRHKKTKQ